MASHGMVMRSRTAASGTAGRDPHGPLPLPVAVLTIGTLSAGLWLGIGWLIAALL
jgi:hypothetical protein